MQRRFMTIYGQLIDILDILPLNQYKFIHYGWGIYVRTEQLQQQYQHLWRAAMKDKIKIIIIRRRRNTEKRDTHNWYINWKVMNKNNMRHMAFIFIQHYRSYNYCLPGFASIKFISLSIQIGRLRGNEIQYSVSSIFIHNGAFMGASARCTTRQLVIQGLPIKVISENDFWAQRYMPIILKKYPQPK